MMHYSATTNAQSTKQEPIFSPKNKNTNNFASNGSTDKITINGYPTKKRPDSNSSTSNNTAWLICNPTDISIITYNITINIAVIMSIRKYQTSLIQSHAPNRPTLNKFTFPLYSQDNLAPRLNTESLLSSRKDSSHSKITSIYQSKLLLSGRKDHSR